MVDFIKSFFGGIVSFFGGILGLKKSDSGKADAAKTRKARGYYMEVEDDSPAWETGNGSKGVTAVSAPKPEPVKAAAPAEATPAKAASVVVVSAPAKVESAPKPEPAKPAVAPAPAAAKVKAEPKQKQETNFATNYLGSLTNTNGRRRPGANMNYFLDMARQVKPSS